MHTPGTYFFVYVHVYCRLWCRLSSWRNSLDRCVQFISTVQYCLKSETKLYFPSVFCWVSYNKLKLVSCVYSTSAAKKHGYYVLLLTAQRFHPIVINLWYPIVIHHRSRGCAFLLPSPLLACCTFKLGEWTAVGARLCVGEIPLGQQYHVVWKVGQKT